MHLARAIPVFVVDPGQIQLGQARHSLRKHEPFVRAAIVDYGKNFVLRPHLLFLLCRLPDFFVQGLKLGERHRAARRGAPIVARGIASTWEGGSRHARLARRGLAVTERSRKLQDLARAKLLKSLGQPVVDVPGW